MNNRGSAAQPTEPTAAENNRKPSRAAISRHKRKCTICQHPQRDQIEQEFLQWRSPRTIAEFYKLTERAVYRHAHALRLFERRGNNIRFSLSHILERVEHVPVTADSIIEAVRIFAHISEDGRWVNPPRHVIIERIGQDSPASSPIASATDQKPASAARSLRQIAINTALEPAASGAVSASLPVSCDYSDEISSPARCSQPQTSGFTTHASNRQSPPGKIRCNSLKTIDQVAV